MEPFGGHSNSPSPTAELMRGAGTTPILSNVPEGGFGDAVETAEEGTASVILASEEPASDIWGSSTAASITPTSSSPSTTTTIAATCDDLFGTPFEPTIATTIVPTAVVTPLSVQPAEAETAEDLFGFDSSELNKLSEQPPLSSQPCAAPPPSPFGGLDIGLGSVSAPSQDLRAQAIANAVGVALPLPVSQISATASAGIEDLNFVLPQTIQSAVSPVLAVSPTLSGTFPGPRSGFVGQPIQSMTTVAGLPMGTTTPPSVSTSLNRLDNIVSATGTPTGRASSTPGYGTPPSGMSSPAKSVASFGAPMPGDLSLHRPGFKCLHFFSCLTSVLSETHQ